MTERTTELLELVDILGGGSDTNKINLFDSKLSLNGIGGSALSGLVRRIDANVISNMTLLTRIEKLTNRREFSNDPTSEMSVLADEFQRTIANTQRDIELVKSKVEQHLHERHNKKHYTCIITHNQKQLSEQISKFQKLIEVHSQHVYQRQKRVSRYGSGTNDMHGLYDHDNNTKMQSYAMFNEPKNDLRKRNHQSISNNNKGINNNNSHIQGGSEDISNSNRGTMNVLQMKPTKRVVDQHTLRRTEAVETSIAKMGKLFTEMASLVMEQGETVGRIEDDVEAGLEDTKIAHESITNTYLMTVGNRSMILKIFALLVLFSFIFLVWMK